MVQSKFFHFFPVPSFLQMPAAGLSISDDAVRFIRFRNKEMRLELDSFGESKLPHGTISGGNILDKDGVAKSLSALRQKFRLKHVRVTIPDEKVYLFKVSLPALAPEEIRSALEFKIEENAPLPLKETVFDYSVVGSAAAGKIGVVVAAAHQKVVYSYIDVLRKAGLQPVAFELESQAIANAILPKREKEDGVVLLIHFGDRCTGLYLVKSGIVHFSLSLPNEDGGETPKAEAARSSSAYQKLYSPKYKKLPMVKEEMERVANYWQSREQGIAGEEYKIVLSGADVTDHEFVEYFSGLIKRNVEIGNAWANALSTDIHIPDVPKEESFRYAPAIGAALSDFEYEKNHV